MVNPEQGEGQYSLPAELIEVNNVVIMPRLTPADTERFHRFFANNESYLRDMMPPSGPPTIEKVGGMFTSFESAHGIGRAAIWGVVLRESPEELHGNVQVSNRVGNTVELGYMRAENVPASIRMSEAVRAVIRHGVDDLGIRRFRAMIAPDNAASQRLIQRLGGVRDAETDSGMVRWEIRYDD